VGRWKTHEGRGELDGLGKTGGRMRGVGVLRGEVEGGNEKVGEGGWEKRCTKLRGPGGGTGGGE